MLTGKSVWHVNQDIGKCFSTGSIKGYYNNMTEKVTKMPELLDNEDLPLLNTGGRNVEMPVAIFQYGLGAYDLFLQTKEEKYLKKFYQTVRWALNNQDNQGRWNNFFYIYPTHPYGAMAQGEGASLLVRAYIKTGNNQYLEAARKALDFMLLPLSEGGTTNYEDRGAFLFEYTFKGLVLNGAIFAWWGLFDYVLASGDSGKYYQAKKLTLQSLIDILPSFTTRHWSKYSMDGLIASPFYHHLHIAQMQAMYQITGCMIFDDFAKKWEKYEKNPFFKTWAFIIKAVQKIKEQK